MANATADNHNPSQDPAPNQPHADQVRLVKKDDRLWLHGPRNLGLGGVCVDFSNIDLRTGPGNLSRKQPLGRAIGQKAHTVIDATAGMGHDAFLLACMGYHVLAIERSPLIAALLADGLRRALEDDHIRQVLSDRLTLKHADALEILQQPDITADVVYIDPMFPPKRKSSALPKKELQLLRIAVGNDPDASQLLDIARRVARQRVVVKRSPHAPPLDKPSTSIRSKLVRYDIYLNPSPPTGPP